MTLNQFVDKTNQKNKKKTKRLLIHWKDLQSFVQLAQSESWKSLFQQFLMIGL